METAADDVGYLPVDKETLDRILRRFVADVLRPEDPCVPIVSRVRDSLRENAPLLREASSNSVTDLLAWARRGSPFRTLFLATVGLILLLGLTGLLCFMVFFIVATLNATIIAFLVSLAAAGGMLAVFFAFLAAIYIGAVSTAVVVISTITISAVIAVFIAAGWVSFFWIVWLVASKSMDLTKQSIRTYGPAVLAPLVTRDM